MIKLVLHGVDRFVDKVKKMEAAKIAKLKAILKEGAIDIHHEMIVLIMQGEKTGRIYGNHQASAPGEAPATDSGELVKGLMPPIFQDNGLTVYLKATAEHSLWMEFGTHNENGSVRIAPRPFMGPANNKFFPIIKKKLEGVRWKVLQ